MRINQLEKITKLFHELDVRQADFEANSKMHPIIRDALIGTCIELRAALIEKYKREHNLDIEI